MTTQTLENTLKVVFTLIFIYAIYVVWSTQLTNPIYFNF